MRKPVVGEKLYAEFLGGKNYKCENQEVEVIKVGRQYFYVSDLPFTPRFRISDWGEAYEYGGAAWKLYENKKAFEEHDELCKLKSYFKKTFETNYYKTSCNITLDQARRIKAILDESN